MRIAPGLAAAGEAFAEPVLRFLKFSVDGRLYSAEMVTDSNPKSWAIISSIILISKGGAGSVSDRVKDMPVRCLLTVADTTRAPL